MTESLAKAYIERADSAHECNLERVARERYRVSKRQSGAAATEDATSPSPAREPAPVETHDELPEHAAAFLDLPHGLGLLQRYALGRARYPSPVVAAAFALMAAAHFTCRHVTVDGLGPLSTDLYILVLAPTGFGKEDPRAALQALDDYARSHAPSDANLRALRQPTLQYSLPASAQAMHAQLEANGGQTYLADEFGDWVARAAIDSHRQAAMAYMMEAFSRHHGTIAPPGSVTRLYTPVKNPRVNVLGTSTADRALSTMSGAHGAAGFYNRFLIVPAEQTRIPKRYSGFKFEPSADVVGLIDWLLSLSETVVELAPDARAVFEQIDDADAEPLKFKDAVLAGRLGEHALKIAALIALSDRRTTVMAADVETAFAIRLALYRRAAALIGHDGALSGMHETGKAAEQLTALFRRRDSIPRAHLANYSRAYKALSVAERDAVVRSLVNDGIVRVEGSGKLISRLHVDAL